MFGWQVVVPSTSTQWNGAHSLVELVADGDDSCTSVFSAISGVPSLDLGDCYTGVRKVIYCLSLRGVS